MRKETSRPILLSIVAFMVGGLSLSMAFAAPQIAGAFEQAATCVSQTNSVMQNETATGAAQCVHLFNNGGVSLTPLGASIGFSVDTAHSNLWTALQESLTVPWVTDTGSWVYHNIADANPTTKLGDALLSFGAGGASAIDTTISRVSAGLISIPSLQLQSGSTMPSGTIFTCTIPSATNLVNAATEYYMPQSTCPASGSEASVANYYPVKGLAVNLFIAIQSAPGLGNSWVFSVKDSGNNALTCTISGASATTCSDTTHNEAFAAGDVFSIKVTQTGTPAASGYALMSFQVEPEG